MKDERAIHAVNQFAAEGNHYPTNTEVIRRAIESELDVIRQGTVLTFGEVEAHLTALVEAIFPNVSIVFPIIVDGLRFERWHFTGQYPVGKPFLISA